MFWEKVGKIHWFSFIKKGKDRHVVTKYVVYSIGFQTFLVHVFKIAVDS